MERKKKVFEEAVEERMIKRREKVR